MEDVVIVGGGIAGLATAVALKKVGVRALVLERSDGLRTTGAALTLFPNAWLALDALGVSHKLISIYTPALRGSITNVSTGAVQTVSYSVNDEGKEAHVPRAVHRRALLEALAEELPPHSIRFSTKITSIETIQHGGVSIPVVHLEDGTVIKAKVLVGCDGVHSVVAKWLGLSAPFHSGRSAVRGISIFPQGHDSKQQVKQFVDVGKRAGIVPINDNELYWFLSCSEDKNMFTEPEIIQKELLEKYSQNFPPLYLDVVRHADLSTLTWAPLMLRNPWNVISGSLSKGNVTVAGDAMHPMTPDLGQGGCSSLEDAVVLGRHIGHSFIKNGSRIDEQEMAQAIAGFVKERRWRAAGLIAGSYLSGWIQQNGSNWWMKFLRDYVFYGFLFRKLFNRVYDCGELPSSKKKD